MDFGDFYEFKQLPSTIQNTITPEKPRNTPAPVERIPREITSDLLEAILTKAINQSNGSRNATGLWLSCQLRDNQLTKSQCAPYLIAYAAAVRNKGEHVYEESEALNSLDQAFTRPAREPYSAPNNANRDLYNSVYVPNTPLPIAKPNTNLTDNLTNTQQPTQQPLSERIEAWIKNTRGWFSTDELDRELGISAIADKNNRMVIMGRLVKDGILSRHPSQNKQWRFIDIKRTNILYKNASAAGIIPVKWPLGIENKVNLLPGNIAVIAGVSGTGKTTLGLNFIKLNQDKFHIHLFCSEMDEAGVQLRERLELFEGIDINEWTFDAHYQTEHFEDVIEPDAINVIDYLEMTTNLFEINIHLTAISHKIGSGLAVVFIQKKMGALLGYGGEFSMFKASLYVNLDLNKATIVKGRSWANKMQNPAGLYREFRIFNGSDFRTENDWQRGD